MPFTSTATPPVDSGSGTLVALLVVGERSDPNTLTVAPGAMFWLKLAPLLRLVMAGVPFEPDPEAVTLTETDALLAPLYVAVMVPLPNGNRALATCSVA